MKFGAALLTQYPAERDPTECRDEVAAQARLVEELGFDSLWITEHHFLEEHLYFDNLQLLSYLANVTDDVRLGTGVCLVPLYNPVRLAERTANLDVLSDGRFVFGAGAGYRDKELEVMGIPPEGERRRRRTEEGIELIRRLWTEDHVSFSGEEYEFTDVTTNPKPVQDPGPEIWFGGRSPAAIRRAVRTGNAWLPPPADPITDLEKMFGYYDDQIESAGETPSERPLMREVYVAETTKEAHERALESLLDKYSHYSQWTDGDHYEYSSDYGVDEDEFDERFIIGTPDHAIERIEDYRNRFDVDHLIIRGQWPLMDHDVMTTSARLFAEEVMPSFV